MKHDRQAFWRTIFGVILIGSLFFTGSALYDQIIGGPSARQAAIDTRDILNGFDRAKARDECVNTYVVADASAQALLTIAFGRLIEAFDGDEETQQTAITGVRRANMTRLYYLTLRAKTNSRCNPNREGGPRPLTQDQMPELFSSEEN